MYIDQQTCAFSEDGDAVGIASIVGDVVPDPLQRHNLIMHAEQPAVGVARLELDLRQRQKAPQAEAIIDAHHHNVAVVRQAHAAVGAAGSIGEAASVD